jgi:hypothetical protein
MLLRARTCYPAAASCSLEPVTPQAGALESPSDPLVAPFSAGLTATAPNGVRNTASGRLTA